MVKSKSFLICHRGALGDFILTWPSLYCLRRLLPQLHFTAIGRIQYMHLAKMYGLIDSCLDLDSSVLLPFFCGTSLPELIGRPEGAVLWLSDFNGPETVLKTHASLPIVTISPFQNNNVHITRYYCNSIKHHYDITVPQNLADLSLPIVKNERFAVIHPGSGSRKKNYDPCLYLQFVHILQEHGYKKIALIFGPAERENGIMDYFKQKADLILLPDSVIELAHTLNQASLYIGNDSGVSHLAGFMGIPSIVLYKITSPQIWGVIGKKIFYITENNENKIIEKITDIAESIQ